MAVTLDRATFKRLVWLYIASAIVSALALVPQYFLPRWADFSVAFDQLVLNKFGDDHPSLAFLYVVAVLSSVAFVLMIASLFGLLWFKRWARWGSWASLILLFAMYGMIFGFRPSFSTIIDDVIALIDGALFGAIMLLAYASGLGAEWFDGPTAVSKG